MDPVEKLNLNYFYLGSKLQAWGLALGYPPSPREGIFSSSIHNFFSILAISVQSRVL